MPLVLSGLLLVGGGCFGPLPEDTSTMDESRYEGLTEDQRATVKVVEVKLEEYYAAVESEDYETLVAMVDEGELALTPREEWLALWEQIASMGGAFQSYELLDVGTAVAENTGDRMVRALVGVYYENGPREEEITWYAPEDRAELYSLSSVGSVPVQQ